MESEKLGFVNEESEIWRKMQVNLIFWVPFVSWWKYIVPYIVVPQHLLRFSWLYFCSMLWCWYILRTIVPLICHTIKVLFVSSCNKIEIQFWRSLLWKWEVWIQIPLINALSKILTGMALVTEWCHTWVLCPEFPHH